ncbi:MAG TPA: hypothetical protein VM123_05230, partial [archaeon]|nr:hypothetical protein [archaeon]
DARSRGMGGVSAAVTGEDFSFTNPARTVNFWRSGFNGVVSQDYTTLKTPGGESSIRSTDFIAFRGVFPTYKGFVVSWGIYQWRDLSWEYSDRVRVDILQNELARSFTSSGGLYVTRLGIARTVNKHLALGIGLDWLIGRVNRNRSLDFEDTSYLNSKEQFNSRYAFFRPTFGLLAAYKKVQLGISATLPRTASVDYYNAYISGYTDKQTQALKYPFCWRMGISYRLTRRAVIGADMEFENWKDAEYFSDPLIEITTQKRFCLGFELMPSAEENPSFYRKIPFRVGYSFARYPFKIDGYDYSERLFSVGTGRYFGRNNGLVDLALEFCRRKTDAPGYPEEGIFRVIVSLSAFERWIGRPQRK